MSGTEQTGGDCQLPDSACHRRSCIFCSTPCFSGNTEVLRPCCFPCQVLPYHSRDLGHVLWRSLVPLFQGILWGELCKASRLSCLH